MDSIDNYTDFKRLGDGSFGTVYSARRLPTNKLYALKKVPKYLPQISFIDSRMCEKQASLN
jgi:serine/threonine protein kinase